MTEPGVKHDNEKPRYSLLPWDAIAQIVNVLEYGAKKYSVSNWEKVPGARTRYFDAAMRHLLAWRAGKERDESGHSHLAHATSCLLFLLAFETRGKFPPEET